MDNYALVIDISSDEEEQRTMARQSTPIKVAPVNVITTLNLSGSSLEATKGSAEELMSSINELNLSNIPGSKTKLEHFYNSQIKKQVEQPEHRMICLKDYRFQYHIYTFK